MVGNSGGKNSSGKNSSADATGQGHLHDQSYRRIVAWRAVEAVIDAGAALRLQDQVFRAGAVDAPETRRIQVIRLIRAIRRERALGCQGHWSYNPTRHLALLQALRAEKYRPSHEKVLANK